MRHGVSGVGQDTCKIPIQYEYFWFPLIGKPGPRREAINDCMGGVPLSSRV